MSGVAGRAETSREVRPECLAAIYAIFRARMKRNGGGGLWGRDGLNDVRHDRQDFLGIMDAGVGIEFGKGCVEGAEADGS